MNDLTSTVLVVDDTQQNVQVLSQMLRDNDYKVLAAFNGEDALNLIQKRKPDLILLDVMMPGMDGYEVCKRIRSNSEYDEIPILFLSALSDLDAKIKAFESGGLDYITKPFQQQEVIARIRVHLRLKQLEKERVRNIEELEEKRKHLELMNKEKDEVLGIISHDMRNPLGGIIGITNFLRTEEVASPEEAKDMLNLVEASAERLLSLVNDLLDVALIESKSINMSFDESDLEELTKEVIQLHMPAAKSKGIKLTLHADNAPLVMVDASKFTQIVGNLLSNSLKFTNSGGKIEIHITPQNGQHVIIKVADNGIGIPADIQDKIFKKFATQRVGTKGEKGTGLGMPLVKRYVELHGGTIDVESAEGTGTTFTVQLPLKHDTNPTHNE